MKVWVVSLMQEGYPVVSSVHSTEDKAKAAVEEALHDCYDDGDDVAHIAWKECDGFDAWMPEGSLVAFYEDEPQYLVVECDVE